MARIRSIKPEFWTDEKIVELSFSARLLFIGLWNFADDDGRMLFSPKRLRMQIFPSPSDEISIDDLVRELETLKLVILYSISGVDYLQVKNFSVHQKIDKRSKSKFPPPPPDPAGSTSGSSCNPAMLGESREYPSNSSEAEIAPELDGIGEPRRIPSNCPESPAIPPTEGIKEGIKETDQGMDLGGDPSHSRFVYRGFVFCSECGSPHYTVSSTDHGRQYDYYVCKRRKGIGERSSGRITIPASERCGTRNLRREKLEEILDGVFSRKLTDQGFIRERVEEMKHLANAKTDSCAIARLQAEIQKLKSKRERVIELYVDGMLSREDRKLRIDALDRDKQIAESSLLEMAPQTIQITAEQLAAIFLPLFRWTTLPAEDKRRVLSTMIPEIRVANYAVSGLAINLPPLGNGGGVEVKQSPAERLQCAGLGFYENRRRTAY